MHYALESTIPRIVDSLDSQPTAAPVSVSMRSTNFSCRQRQGTGLSPLSGFGRRMIRTLIILAVSGLIVLTTLASAASDLFDQNKVKAVFVYNLTKFVCWPRTTANRQPESANHFTIGIFGHDVFNVFLEHVVRGEVIDGRLIRVRRYVSLDEIEKAPCQLLFVSTTQMRIWSRIRDIARQHRIFTVGDTDGFGQHGGIANLLTSAQKIAIEINIEEAKRNGFEISSKLLKLARIVGSRKEE